jgi:DUF2993 family protein/FHA domain-containing protein
MRTATVTVVAGSDSAAGPTELLITSAKPWVVGRSHDADVVIKDERVSRRHLVIESAGAAWIVKDISSSGSWHNGTRVGPDGVTLRGAGQLRLNLGDRRGQEIVLFANSPVAADAATEPVDPALTGSTVVLAPALAAAAAPGPAAAPPGPRFRAPVEPPVATGPPRDPVPVPAAGASRRRGRRLAVIALIVIVVFVIADRVAAQAASKKAVGQVVQSSQGLTGEPTVSFGGFPFLTQVAFGKYTDIGVKISGIASAGAPRIARISGHLKGAHIPLSKAMGGHVTKIPVDHVSATVVMTFTDLNAFLKDQPGHLVLGQSKGALRFSGAFQQAGTTIQVTGTAVVTADGAGLTVTPKDVHASGGSDAGGVLDDVTGVLGDAAQFLPPVPVPLPELPFNLRLTSVDVGRAGVQASATADHLVLDGTQR